MKILLLALVLSQSATDDVHVPEAADASSSAAVIVGTDPNGGAVISDDFTGVGEAALEVIDVASNYKAVGGLALAAALITLMVRLSKLGVIGRLLKAHRWGWLRPLLSCVLGGGTVSLAALQAGQPMGPALIAGVLAGLTGVGGHELLRLFSKHEREAQRMPGISIVQLIRIAEDAAIAAPGVSDADIEAAAKLPSPERLARLAKLVSSQGLA